MLIPNLNAKVLYVVTVLKKPTIIFKPTHNVLLIWRILLAVLVNSVSHNMQIDSLRARRFGVQTQVVARFYAPVKTITVCSGVHKKILSVGRT